jgi:hypothetical protein
MMERSEVYELYARSLAYLRTIPETTILSGENESAAPSPSRKSRPKPLVEIAVAIEESGDEARMSLRVPVYDAVTRHAVEEMKASGVVPEDAQVQEVGHLIGFGPTDLVSPLQPGVSCANQDGPPGTLGCFVIRDGLPHFISVNHVLALENNALPQSQIFQPAAGAINLRPIGTLLEFEDLLPSGNLIDGAIATLSVNDLDASIFFSGKRITTVRTAPLNTGDRVFKFGQASLLTEGRVLAPIASNVTLHMDFDSHTFDEQIEIDAFGGSPFAISGDSGALVYDEHDQAIGLVVGGNGVNRTYLSPIQKILTRFQATLV